MTTETTAITNDEDVIDLRDLTARVEELEDEIRNIDTMSEGDQLKNTEEGAVIREELTILTALLEDLAGNGGDHDWRGAWYPLLLVRDSHFKEFAQQEAEDLDLVKPDAGWPYGCIDWEQAADELKSDYSTVEFDGVTYWYR